MNSLVDAQHAIDQLALAPLPERLVPFVATDNINKVFYIDRNKISDPLLLTWLDRAERHCTFSKVYKIEYVEVDEIAAIQARGGRMTAGQQDDEMHVQRQALELIARAAEIGAADIHILVRPTFTEVQVRSKGQLRVLTRNLSREAGHAIIRSMCQSDLAAVKNGSHNPREFQNAQLSGDKISHLGLNSVRLVRGPCYPADADSEFAILRLQYNANHKKHKSQKLETPRRPAGQLNLRNMGLTEQQVEMLIQLVRAPNGIIVFSGPTGSGKTTALYELLAHLAREYPDERLITIEDPVEFQMPWAIQLAITNADTEAEIAAAYGKCLRTALRMDPDTLFIGELRGLETAETAINAALTGHLVFATIHTNDAYQFADRLELMDRRRLARGVFCDQEIVRGLVALRLLKTLCPECSKLLSSAPNTITQKSLLALRSYGALSQVRIRGNGMVTKSVEMPNEDGTKKTVPKEFPCSTCDGDGYSGRTAVAEVVVTDASLMSDYIEHNTATARRNHRRKPDADKSLLENAIIKCLSGIFDPRDVEKEINIITPKGE